MQRSLLLFENSIHSKATFKAYKYAIDKFIEHFKLRDFGSIVEMDNKMLQEMIEDYVMYKKSKGLSRSSLCMPINALQLFCESNDVEIRWKKMGFDMCHSWSASEKLQEIYDKQIDDTENVKVFVV